MPAVCELIWLAMLRKLFFALMSLSAYLIRLQYIISLRWHLVLTKQSLRRKKRTRSELVRLNLTLGRASLSAILLVFYGSTANRESTANVVLV